MLTGEAVRVGVTKQDIFRANDDFCPITRAVSRVLKEDSENIQIQRKAIFVFDEYDHKKDVYLYEDEYEEKIIQFLDSWDRYLCGSNESFDPFQFSLTRRQ